MKNKFATKRSEVSMTLRFLVRCKFGEREEYIINLKDFCNFKK